LSNLRTNSVSRSEGTQAYNSSEPISIPAAFGFICLSGRTGFMDEPFFDHFSFDIHYPHLLDWAHPDPLAFIRTQSSKRGSFAPPMYKTKANGTRLPCGLQSTTDRSVLACLVAQIEDTATIGNLNKVAVMNKLHFR